MGSSGSPEPNLDGKGLRIAVLVSRYNPQVCEGLLEGALRELNRLGIPREQVPVHQVPGAFELPLSAKWMARGGNFDALICLGAVIRGGTPHFEYVCLGATQGVIQTMLETEVPIAFGVLTTDNQEQALARASDNGNNKGLEAARTAVEMAILKKKMKTR